MHSVVFLSQFNTCFGTEHWNAATKRVVKYLKSTIGFGLIFKKDDFEINGFVDADWGSIFWIENHLPGMFLNLVDQPYLGRHKNKKL